MADKTPEKETEETEETKKPAGLVVPLIIVMVLMPIVAYLTTNIFLAKKLAESIAENLDGVEYIESNEKEEDKNKQEEKITDDDGKEITPEDDFLMERQQVNVKNTNGSRSLWVSLLIEGKEKGGLGYKIEKSRKIQAYFREETGDIIGQFELTEMDSSATKAKAKAQMITAFNDILNNILNDDDAVKDVIIESWSIQ
jgi:flagellar basal body-associated protein FliL